MSCLRYMCWLVLCLMYPMFVLLSGLSILDCPFGFLQRLYIDQLRNKPPVFSGVRIAQPFVFCVVFKCSHRIINFITTYTDTAKPSSYSDLQLEMDSQGHLQMKLYKKRDDFNFLIVNFPFIGSNIAAAPGYGVHIQQLIRYSRALGSYQNGHVRELLLTRQLLNQGFIRFTVAIMTWFTITEYLCHK